MTSTALESDASKQPSTSENQVTTIPSTTVTSSSSSSSTAIAASQKCCAWARFQGVPKAQGYAFAAFGHGCIFMSNVFLSASFIYLASEEAGCFDEDGSVDTTNCETRVYGFLPSSFVTNIAAIAGLLAAFFMPWIGAVIDYTSRRRRVGMIIATLLWLVQTVQIATVSSTWFPMAILQAVAGALFEIHYLVTVSYLPDLVRYHIDGPTMTRFNRSFYIIQFGGEVIYLLLVVVIATAGSFNDVRTAQAGQLVCSLWLLYAFPNSWKALPEMQGRHVLNAEAEVAAAAAEGGEPPKKKKNLLVEGFRENWRTCVKIYHHNPTLKWFFGFICIVEAGTTSLLPVAISFLSRTSGLNGQEIGISFLLTLCCAVPGSVVGSVLSRKYNPVVSLKIDLCLVSIWTIIGSFVLAAAREARQEEIDNGTFDEVAAEDELPLLSWLWGSVWGFFMGWFYAGEQLLFSFCLPPGQEAELSGFFVYCTIVLTWLPPLIVSIMVESGVDDKWGLAPIAICQILGFLLLFGMPPWEEVLAHAKNSLLDEDEANIPAPRNASIPDEKRNSDIATGTTTTTQEKPVDQ